MLNQLVFHSPVGAQLAAGGVAAVEAHKGVGELVVVTELAGNFLLIQGGGHGVVDVQQSHRVPGDAQADVLGQGAVNIHLAGHGNAPAGQAGVDIAGLKAELAGESGPTFVCKGHILAAAFVVLRPIQQGQLKLGHALQQVGIVPALAHLLGHVGAHIGNAGIPCVFLVGDQQVQLAVFLNLHTQVVQALNGSVAGEKVLGPGAEGDDLQIPNAQNRPGNGHKLRHFLRNLRGGAHRVFGDVTGQAPQPQIVGAVEHAAVGVSPAIDQVPVPLGSRHKHAGAVKVLGDEGLRSFRAKVAQKHGQSVAAGLLDFLHSGQHVLFVFHGGLSLVDVQTTGGAGCHHGGPAALRKGNGETVPGDCHKAQFYLRDIGHL